MGHISEAFRGSLAHLLVSANHCCNREPNLYRSFNQTRPRDQAVPGAEWSSCLSGTRPKQTLSWKLKRLWWHNDMENLFMSSSLRSGQQYFCLEDIMSFFFPLSFSAITSNPDSTSAGSQSLRLRTESDVVWLAADIWGWQLTEKRDTLLETGWQADNCSPLSPPVSGKMNRPPRLSAETEEFLARSQGQNAYRRICSTCIMGKWELTFPLVANPDSAGRGGVFLWPTFGWS